MQRDKLVEEQVTHMKHWAIWSVAASALLFISQFAAAGPPFLTDDPEPVEYQHHEFYIASQRTKTADGAAGTLPHLEYNYGAAPDVQLHVIVPYVFSHPAGDTHQKGLGDVEVGVKYRILQETDSSPMVGIFLSW